MDITTYLKSETGLSIRGIAERAGLEQSKLNKQLKGDTSLSMETLRDVARGNNLDMLKLFKIAGKITPLEEKRLRSTGAISYLSDEDLADEILRRMKRGATYYDEHSPFETHDSFDLAAKRSTESKGEPDPFE